MAFEVTGDSFDPREQPGARARSTRDPGMLWPESAAVATRRFDFGPGDGQWTINETTWEDVVDSGFTKVLATPRHRGDLGAAQPLRRVAPPGAHPLRGLPRPDPQRQAGQAQERGAKDVVYLGENETVRVLVGFHGSRAAT